MYGLLLDGIGQAIVKKYGEDAWAEIRKKAGIHQPTFGKFKSISCGWLFPS